MQVSLARTVGVSSCYLVDVAPKRAIIVYHYKGIPGEPDYIRANRCVYWLRRGLDGAKICADNLSGWALTERPVDEATRRLVEAEVAAHLGVKVEAGEFDSTVVPNG